MTRERAIQILKMSEQEKWRSGITVEEEKEAVDMAIEALNRPHGEWIPCSERLPKKEQKIYLVTIDYGSGLSCVAPRFFWNKERGWNEAEDIITAWMPCPDPYEKEG